MAAEIIPGILSQLSGLGSAGILYVALVAIIALAGVFSRTPDRRQAALQVLQVLVPRRRQGEPEDRSGPTLPP